MTRKGLKGDATSAFAWWTSSDRLEAHQHVYGMIPEANSVGVRRPRSESYHSSPVLLCLRMSGGIPPLLQIDSWHMPNIYVRLETRKENHSVWSWKQAQSDILLDLIYFKFFQHYLKVICIQQRPETRSHLWAFEKWNLNDLVKT